MVGVYNISNKAYYSTVRSATPAKIDFDVIQKMLKGI